MKRGDIDMVSLDPTQGHEQRGHRPVVVVPPDAFNVSAKLPVVVPITSGGGARRLGFAVPLSGNRFWLAWREVIDDDHWRGLGLIALLRRYW